MKPSLIAAIVAAFAFGVTPALAMLPAVTSGNLVAHFEATPGSLTLDGADNVLAWQAKNNPAINLAVGGTDDPANIRFNPTGMGPLGTIEVNDFSGDNRYLRGSLGSDLNGATIFWVGYYQPGRDGSLGDGSGQYAYSLGRAGGQGAQMDHQIDDGRFELYGGGGTQGGNHIDYLNGSYSVFQTNYYPGDPGHQAFANGFDLNVPSDGGYFVPAAEDLLLFGWQNGSAAAGGYNFVGNMSELIIYDGVLDGPEAAAVYNHLASKLPSAPPEPPTPPEPVTLYAPLGGSPNTQVPGFVPHGNDEVSGYAKFTIYPNNTMDYEIVVDGNEYEPTQAHFYNINKTSGTSGNPAFGDSIICWGGRWESGGDSDEYLQGTGYYNGRLQEVIANPEDWMLIVHTEGGHFANDESGGLIPYNSAVHETNELGVPESERPTRFNNRVGRTLLDLTLRQDNTNDPSAPYYDPNDPLNMASSPFADANGNKWVEYDSNLGEYVLTSEALSRGYDLQTEYLFFLYDDQGPTWDFGGPEGAFGGFLTTQPIPEPSAVLLMLTAVVVLSASARRNAIG
ncbi:hypothetical protein [Aeoliella sp.]|uniref:hypothetical protein n=1 Tax=Aeoliella sp. TaxID=2795800 RepID=UPI003CCB9658